jgi:hypothetical protein
MDRKTYLDSITADGIDHKRVTWHSTVKPAAAHASHTLRKITTCLVMRGAEYQNLSEVKASKSAGTATPSGAAAQDGGLPWGEWDVYPHIITHKGTDYARLYVLDGTINSIYTVDGEVVTRDEFNAYLTPSAAKAGRPNGGTVTVKIENVKSIV